MIDGSGFDDVDLAAVDELLTAARRGPADPDVDLAQLVHRLEGASDAEVLAVLEQLVRDAHPY